MLFFFFFFFNISDEYGHWILLNVELSNSKVIKSWKTLSNKKMVTNMKIITVNCKKMKTTTTLKLSQIWKAVTGKCETFKFQILRPIIIATRKNIFAKQDQKNIMNQKYKEDLTRVVISYRDNKLNFIDHCFIRNLWNELSTTSVRFCLSYVSFKDVRWLQLFVQTFFLHLFFASNRYNKTFNTEIAIG